MEALTNTLNIEILENIYVNVKYFWLKENYLEPPVFKVLEVKRGGVLLDLNTLHYLGIMKTINDLVKDFERKQSK